MEKEFKLGDKVLLNGHSVSNCPILVVTKIFDSGYLQLTFYNRQNTSFDKTELPKECVTKIG